FAEAVICPVSIASPLIALLLTIGLSVRLTRCFRPPHRTILKIPHPTQISRRACIKLDPPLQLTEIPCEIQRCPESYSCEGGASRRGVLGRVRKTILCGHPKQGIQGEQNQSLATRVEVGFLGSLGL